MFRMIYIKEKKLILKSTVLFVFLIYSASLIAQTEKKYIRKGNRDYEKDKYSESEILYRKAIDKNKQAPDAVFNVGDALYKQNKYEEAGKQFEENANQNNDKIKKSAGYYNMGNSLFKANKLEESINAYKNSLKLHPDNPEAKYNLSYAQDMLKKQQQQKQQQDKNNQNKNKQDKNKDKNKQDQNKDQKDKNDQNKDQDNKQDQNKQQQSQQISKEDAQRLLNSMANDEKNVQEKVKLAKAAKNKVRTVKNW